MTTKPKPILTIITVALDLRDEEFDATARSLMPLLNQVSNVEWLVVPGIESTSSHKQAKILPPNGTGIYEAMNDGLARAQGAYVWFLNGGDELVSPESATALIEALTTTPPPDFLYTDSVEGDWYKPSRPHTLAHQGMFTHHQAMIYRRTIIGEARYPSQYQIAGDYAFTLTHLAKADIIQHLPIALCHFKPGGLSSQHAKQGQREQRAIRRELLGGSVATEAWTGLRQGLSRQLRHWMPGLWARLRVGLRP